MKRQIWISAVGLALAASLHAQTPQVELDGYRNLINIIPLAGESGEPSWLSGHPYSGVARTITYSPDGSHVDRSVTETVYRDDQGRTRREMNGGKNVSITDPVAGMIYSLNPETKAVMKHTIAPAAIERQSKAPSQTPLEMARAQAARREDTTVEDLGTQIVNGVSAQGVRIITTTPAGTVGNDHDLQTVLERWVSTDLHVMVKSVTTHPSSGATHYDLTGLVTASPDASLFQVPAGYTIQEGGGRGGRGGGQ